ncbi:MAG: MOSC domain-containing protein [Rhizobiaceae bacterium]
MTAEQPSIEAAATPVGTVAALWRYPISSTAGEALDEAELVETGIAGDRQYALVDPEIRQTASPERYRRWHPAPLVSSRWSEGGRLEVSADGVDWRDPLQESGRELLARHFGFPVEVRAYGRDRSTDAVPRYVRAPLHVLTTASLRALERLLPGSSVAVSRFRPNILLDTPGNDDAIEQSWMGRLITVAGVTLRVARPCGRCSFTTLRQDGVPYDRDILRELLRTYERQFGVLCDVVRPGRIRVGDEALIAQPGGGKP